MHDIRLILIKYFNCQAVESEVPQTSLIPWLVMSQYPQHIRKIVSLQNHPLKLH